MSTHITANPTPSHFYACKLHMRRRFGVSRVLAAPLAALPARLALPRPAEAEPAVPRETQLCTTATRV